MAFDIVSYLPHARLEATPRLFFTIRRSAVPKTLCMMYDDVLKNQADLSTSVKHGRDF